MNTPPEAESLHPLQLMMAYLDGELSAEERRDFERLLDEHPEWRAEYNRLRPVVEVPRRLRLRPPDPALWDNYWEEIDGRLQRRFGWIVALVGSVLLILYGFIKVLAYAQNDVVRAGILLVAAGLLILFFTALRGRLLELPRDRYRRIRR